MFLEEFQLLLLHFACDLDTGDFCFLSFCNERDSCRDFWRTVFDDQTRDGSQSLRFDHDVISGENLFDDIKCSVFERLRLRLWIRIDESAQEFQANNT
jgi:hypothetical protein